jgi:hypothetical protein
LIFDTTTNNNTHKHASTKGTKIMTSILLAAAISGLVSGASANAEGPSVRSDLSSGVSGAQTLDDSKGKHSCKGQNACKGQGGCKTDKHACKGQNACKGQGGCHG